MKYGIVAVMLCAVTVHAQESKDLELAYLRAWYQLEVEEKPAEAEAAFRALVRGEKLSNERHVMCMIGVARCLIAQGDSVGGRATYRSLGELVKASPTLQKKIGAALERLGPPAHTGEFKFHYKQGFDFRTRKVTDGANADVIFSSCAGGISSITLVAPGGIMSMESVFGRRKTRLTPRLLVDGIAGAFADRLVLGGSADADSRAPESDVFILRTRSGGWVKMAITHRGDVGGWTDYLATVRYSYNPDRPRFGRLPSNAAESELPIILSRSLGMTEEEVAAVAREKRRQFDKIMKEAGGGGIKADPAKTQEVLLSRSKFKDYEKSTFSFRFGIRDDPELRRTRNNWDLQFGNGGDEFHVRMVTDDRSTITSLGAQTWAALAQRAAIKEANTEKVTTKTGDAYLVHTVDRDTDYYTLVRVAALTPGVACQIEWVSLQNGALKVSPGLNLTAQEKESLHGHLRVLARAAKRN